MKLNPEFFQFSLTNNHRFEFEASGLQSQIVLDYLQVLLSFPYLNNKAEIVSFVEGTLMCFGYRKAQDEANKWEIEEFNPTPVLPTLTVFYTFSLKLDQTDQHHKITFTGIGEGELNYDCLDTDLVTDALMLELEAKGILYHRFYGDVLIFLDQDISVNLSECYNQATLYLTLSYDENYFEISNHDIKGKGAKQLSLSDFGLDCFYDRIYCSYSQAKLMSEYIKSHLVKLGFEMDDSEFEESDDDESKGFQENLDYIRPLVMNSNIQEVPPVLYMVRFDLNSSSEKVCELKIRNLVSDNKPKFGIFGESIFWTASTNPTKTQKGSSSIPLHNWGSKEDLLVVLQKHCQANNFFIEWDSDYNVFHFLITNTNLVNREHEKMPQPKLTLKFEKSNLLEDGYFRIRMEGGSNFERELELLKEFEGPRIYHTFEGFYQRAISINPRVYDISESIQDLLNGLYNLGWIVEKTSNCGTLEVVLVHTSDLKQTKPILSYQEIFEMI